MLHALSLDLANAVERAVEAASSMGHGQVTPEHLLLALCADAAVCDLLRGAEVGPEAVNSAISEYLSTRPRQIGRTEAKRGPDFMSVVERASAMAETNGRGVAGTADALVCIFAARESYAVALLTGLGLRRHDVVSLMGTGRLGGRNAQPPSEQMIRPGSPPMATADSHHGAWQVAHGRAGSAPQRQGLEAWCENLTAKATAPGADPVIGRDAEVERCLLVLSRRKKNNPVLVGEPGVGKSAVAEALARRIATGDTHPRLRGATVWSLDLPRMLAGARFRGDFEERLKGVMDEMALRPADVLFIDEIHGLMGAGDAKGGLDAANILKPALASGAIRCLGATTFKEYRKHIERDEAMDRRFQPIEVKEPGEAEAEAMVAGAMGLIGVHHGVAFADDAARAAVSLAVRHLPSRRLPDKAIDALDDAAAIAVATGVPVVGPREVRMAVAAMSGKRPDEVGTDERAALRGLDADLRSFIFGQDRACGELAAAVRRSRTPVRDPERPVGSFLFAGPTGVGKTEVTRRLARILGLELVRLDMSEYMEKHSVSRLIGAPPGYVGHDRGGVLTEAVNRQPHCILLVDEVEKAHEDVLNLFLQVMDAGRLTDAEGRVVDFRNVLLVMTTNAGAEEAATRPGLGFGAIERGGDPDAAIRRRFTPEFRNRLDEIVWFEPLGAEAMLSVVDRHLEDLRARLAPSGVALDATSTARDWLAREGSDREFGARPLKRLFRRRVGQMVADQILFEGLDAGGTVTLDIEGDDLTVRCVAQDIAA